MSWRKSSTTTAVPYTVTGGFFGQLGDDFFFSYEVRVHFQLGKGHIELVLRGFLLALFIFNEALQIVRTC